MTFSVRGAGGPGLTLPYTFQASASGHDAGPMAPHVSANSNDAGLRQSNLQTLLGRVWDPFFLVNLRLQD